MQGKRVAVLVLLASNLLLAGCAGSSQNVGPKNASDPTVARAGGFDNVDPADAGEIVGRVVDDEFRTLPDVTVRLLGTPAETRTTQDGIYYISKVPPRAYTISFSKLGYETKNHTILVGAKQRITADAVIAKVADTSPFIDATFTFRGRINCSGRVNVSGTNANHECGAIQASSDTSRMRYLDLVGGVRWLLVEVAWLPSVPVVNDKLNLALRPCDCPSWRQIQGSSPIKFMMGPAEFANFRNFSQRDYARFGGQIQLAMFPGELTNQQGAGAGATAQQEFTIYATAFYRMDPPAGYSRLPRP